MCTASKSLARARLQIASAVWHSLAHICWSDSTQQIHAHGTPLGLSTWSMSGKGRSTASLSLAAMKSRMFCVDPTTPMPLLLASIASANISPGTCTSPSSLAMPEDHPKCSQGGCYGATKDATHSSQRSMRRNSLVHPPDKQAAVKRVRGKQCHSGRSLPACTQLHRVMQSAPVMCSPQNGR